MTDAEIKALYGRRIQAMQRRPSFGRGVGRARIRIGAGFACQVEHLLRRLRAVDSKYQQL